MDRTPGPFHDPQLERLELQEHALEAACRAEEFSYSGLKDLDQSLELCEVRLRSALLLLEAPRRDHVRIREKASAAVGGLERLLGENLSEEQRPLVTSAPGYLRCRELFQQFILRGGGGYLSGEEQDERRSRRVARAVVRAIRKYLGLKGPLAAECGLEEEELYSSEKMRVPLSQAVLYLESELLPSLESALKTEPGNRGLQDQLRSARERLAAYRRLRFAPRSTPIVIERGFYTEWWSEFTSDGELLVSLPLPVEFRSGTNLDRLQELVQAELVRLLANRRVCPALDSQYRYLKSLESGRRGSFRLPGFKLDSKLGFGQLKELFPALKQIEGRQEFAALVEMVRSSGRLPAVRAVERLLERAPSEPPLLP